MAWWNQLCQGHDEVIKWKYFPRYWLFMREFLSQRPVTRSFHVFFDLCPNKRCVNNGEAGDLRRNRAHYDVIVMEVFHHTWRDPQMSFCRRPISFYYYEICFHSREFHFFLSSGQSWKPLPSNHMNWLELLIQPSVAKSAYSISALYGFLIIFIVNPSNNS